MSFLISLIVVLCATGLVWRFASRRHALPCPAWLGWLVERDNPFTTIGRAETISDHLGLQPGMTVLDLGCGQGRVSLPVARRIGAAGRLVAVDIQPGMLARAEEKLRAAGIDNVEFVQAGAGEDKLGRDRFDRALLVSVLGEIPDREGAFQEIFGALKPGGMLSVTELIFDPHFQRRRVVSRLAHEAGFVEGEFFGNRIAYTLNLEKPARD